MLFFLSVTFFFLFLIVRQSAILRIRFFDRLNFIGIQICDHIYTPVTTLQRPSNNWIDFVFLGVHHQHIHAYTVLHQDYFTIQLHHVPVGQKLIHLVDGQKKDPPYMRGTPFQLKKGKLVLYKRVRKGFGFILEEVATSPEWPIS